MTVAVAARAALVILFLAACVLLVRRRARGVALPGPLEIVARAPLAPGVGRADLHDGERRLLVGWGRDGVRLVRDLGSQERGP